MADRFPLILNTSNNQIQEIASGDQLDLSGNNIANAGIITASTFKGDGDFVELDVDGHTNLDNVSVAGVTTTSGVVVINADTQSTNTTTGALRVAGGAGIVKNVNVGGDLDVDGHTNLDNVSIVGVTTFNGDILFVGDNSKFATWDKSDGRFEFFDDAGLSLGNSDDLQIYHQSSNNQNYIDGITNGITNVRADILVLARLNSDKFAKFTAGGSSELYFSGNKKFETTSAGIDVTGNATVSGNLSVGGVLTYEDVTNVDSVGVVTSRKGVHAGGYSAIGGSPHSYLYGRGSQGGGFSVYAAESAMEAVATNDGTHGASLLLRTATDGVAFNYNPTDNALELKSYTSTANDFTIHNTGSNINDLKNLIKATAGSDVSLYHNGVGVVTTTSSGATINQFVFDQNGITRQSTNSRLVFQGSHETRLYHASNAQIKLSFRGNGDVFRGAVDAQPGFIQLKTGEDESAVVARDNSFTELYYNGSKKLNTENGGVFITGICTATAYHGDGSNLTGVAVDKISEGDTEVECVDSGTGGEVTIKADNTDVMKVIKASESEIIGKVGINQFNNRKSPLTVARGTTNSSEVNLSLTVPSCVVGGGSGIFMKSSSDLSEEKRYGTFLQSVRSDNNNGSAHFIISMENAGATGLRENLRIDPGGQVLPGADNSQNLGSSTKRWANIYSADIHCSNKGSSNVVDGTWGDFTIQEGESDLFLINNRSGKKYKFNLTEVN